MPKVTQKGQVTIPLHIRAMMGIHRGDQVDFEEYNGKIVLTKVKGSKENLNRYVGYLSHLEGKDVDRIVDELRGELNDHCD